MKKQFAALILVIVIAISTNVAVSADTTEEWIVKQQDDGAIYLESRLTNEIIIDAFRFDNSGRHIMVDLPTYAHELNNLPVVANNYANVGQEGLLREPSTAVSNSYKETENYKGIGSGRKVTSDISGPATVNYGESVTVSQAYGGGVTITANIQKVISGGANFSWTSSLSSSAQFSVSYKIPSGKKGYIEFKPYFNVSKGTLTQKNFSQSGLVIGTSKYDVWGQCPIKLSTGFSEGVYAL